MRHCATQKKNLLGKPRQAVSVEGVTICFLFNRGYWVRLLKLEICLYTIQSLRFLKLGLILGFFCFHVRPWHASSSLRRPVISLRRPVILAVVKEFMI